MSEHYLRKLDADMGRAEWKMYRGIPAEEIGWENGAHYLDYEKWREYLQKQIAKEHRDKPKLTYIMYFEQYPIGVAKLKFDFDNDNSREVAYCIRPVCRGKGLGNIMLELLKKQAKELGFTELTGYANKHNVASCKTMESCGFEFIELSEWGSNKYKIIL